MVRVSGGQKTLPEPVNMVRRNVTLSAVHGTEMRVPRISKLEQVCVRACVRAALSTFPAAVCQIK